MAKVLVLPVAPAPLKRRGPRRTDPKFIEGQRLLVQAMQYLVHEDPTANRDAVGLLSEHFRTQFRMSDHPVRGA